MEETRRELFLRQKVVEIRMMEMKGIRCYSCLITKGFIKAKLNAIPSDTHQLQLIKLHHFKQEIFKSI